MRNPFTDKKNLTYILTFSLIIVFFSNALYGNTYYVSPHGDDANTGASWNDSFLTIQTGIDNAADGDTVLVAEGTYTENINFNGKNITVASNYINDQNQNIIQSTIIDGGGNYPSSTVTFNSGEDSTAVLLGFHITGGEAAYGGGIICLNDSNPKLVNLKIKWNFSSELGGGIYIENSSPIIENTEILENGTGIGQELGNGGAGFILNSNSEFRTVNIINNFALPGKGGGLFIKNSNLLLTSCEIKYNNQLLDTIPSRPDALIKGGGIYVRDSELNLKNCDINYNRAEQGGGIHALTSTVIMSGHEESETLSEIIGNEATTSTGGGIHLDLNCYLELNYAIISDNNAAWQGAGIYIEESNVDIGQCMIENNLSVNIGSGIYCSDNSTVSILGSDIMNNSAVSGGGIAGAYNCDIDLDNVLFFNNSAFNRGGAIFLRLNNTGSLDIDNITVTGNTADEGGGIYSEQMPVDIYGSIFYNNTPDQIVYDIQSNDNTLSISYSNIEGGFAEIITEDTAFVNWLGGNMDVDPLFADPVNGDFSLDFESPCINAGGEGNYDPDGSPRDLGYEYYPLTLGDVNDDGEWNVLDIIRITNFILESDIPNNAESWTADTNVDGNIDVLDTVVLNNCILDNNCGDTLGRGFITVTGSASIYLSDSGVNPLYRGEGNVFDIVIENTEPVSGFQLDLSFDGSEYEINDVELSDVASGLELEYSSLQDGNFRILAYPIDEFEIPAGINHVATISVSGLTRTGENAGIITINEIVSDVFGNNIHRGTNDEPAPQRFSIDRVYPNPFNPSFTMDFSIDEPGLISMTIYDLNGNQIEKLIDNRFYSSGKHSIVYHADDIATGMYFIRMEGYQWSNVYKVLYLK